MAGRLTSRSLLRQVAPQVLGAVVRRYGNFDLAEDAVQECIGGGHNPVARRRRSGQSRRDG